MSERTCPTCAGSGRVTVSGPRPRLGSRAARAAGEVFVYRNRPDDNRRRSDMEFCESCGGWYGRAA